MVDIFAKEGMDVKPQEKVEIPPISMGDLNEVKPAIKNNDEASVRLKAQPVDIFAEEKISSPSITERNTNAMKAGIELDNPKNEDEKVVADNVKQSLSDMETLAQSRFTPEQIAEFKNNPITFTGAGKFLNAQNTLPGGGVYQAFDLIIANKAAKKLQAGEKIDGTEELMLNKVVDTYVEQSLRGFTIGGRVAYGLAQMPAFAVEFVASGGVGKLAAVATEKAVQKAATNLAVAGTAKTVAVKTASITANVVARTAVMPTLYAPKYGERRFNDSVAITDKGDLILRASEESPAKSALMAFGYSSAEVASEMAGGAIGKYVLDPVRGLLKTPLISAVNKLPVGVRSAVYEAYKKINPNAQVSKVFTAAGWNGMIEEMGEEQVNRVMQGAIALMGDDQQAAADSKNYTFGDFIDQVVPSGDDLLVEAGIIAIAGGVKTSADLTMNLLKGKGIAPAEVRQMVDTMTANEQEQFVRENLVAPVSGFVPNFSSKIERTTDPITGSILVTKKIENNNGEAIGKIIARQFVYNGKQAVRISNSGIDQKEDMGKGYGINAYKDFADQVLSDGMELHSDTEISQAASNMYESLAKRGYTVEKSKNALFHGSHLIATNKNEPVYRVTGRQSALVQDIAGGTPQIEIDEQEAISDGAPPSPVFFEGEISQGQIAAVEKSDPPPIIDEESIANKMYREWANELDPIQKLPEMARARGKHVGKMMDTRLLSSLYSGVLGQIRQTLQVNTFTFDGFGDVVITGKSLKSTLDDFDNTFIAAEPKRKAREDDFIDYLTAQRYLEDLSKNDDVEVTEEQRLKSISDLSRLSSKYGQDFHFFEVFAQEVYDFQRRVLQNLVFDGVMPEETFNQIVSKNPNYVPFQRVMDNESFGGTISTKGVFTDANANRIIKKISGSDREVKNVFHSIIKNTARIMDMGARNRVALSIANLADVLPEYIQREATPMVKKGTTKVKVTYDKRLREKLEATIKLFGEEFEHKKTLNKPGQRGFVRGDYSPAEKLVRLRLGSSDSVLTHEVGHMLDFRIGLRAKMLKDPKVKAQLTDLADQRLSAQTKTIQHGKSVNFEETTRYVESEKHQEYVRNDYELIANFFDAYVNAPDLLKKIAPDAAKSFDKIIDSYEELAFVKQIKPSLERAEEEVEQDVWGEADYAPANTMTVRRGGKKEYYRVSKPILEAIESLSPSQINVLDQIFSTPANVLRAGATLVPEFWVRNVLRDQQGALLQSGVNYRPTDFFKGLSAVIFKSDLYNQWERSGGSFNSFMEMDDKGLEKAYKELFRPNGRLWTYLWPIKSASAISGALEKATRVGVFSRAQQSGQVAIDAAMTSRDATLDFSRRGSIGKKINRYIPFFNAGIQGVDKMIRTFKTNPKAVIFWGVATITMPSVLLTGYYLYGAPDDERREFLEIPEWQRDMFWVAKVGGEWKRYPKPFQLGYIFGSSIERMMIWGYSKNDPSVKSSWEDLALGLAGSMSPVYDPSALIPPLMKVAVEDVTNYNFFTGRKLYPEWMEKLDPEFQSNKYTSETAKMLGKQFDISPAKIDNTLRGTLAGSSDYLTGAGDAIIKQVKEWNGEKVPDEPKTASDIAIAKAFAVRRPAGYRSQSAKYFFENWNEAQRKKASAAKLDGEDRSEYKKKNAVILSQYGQLEDAFESMKKLQKQADKIYDHPDMDAEKKVEQINILEDRITEIARRSNTNYNKVARDE